MSTRYFTQLIDAIVFELEQYQGDLPLNEANWLATCSIILCRQREFPTSVPLNELASVEYCDIQAAIIAVMAEPADALSMEILAEIAGEIEAKAEAIFHRN